MMLQSFVAVICCILWAEFCVSNAQSQTQPTATTQPVIGTPPADSTSMQETVSFLYGTVDDVKGRTLVVKFWTVHVEASFMTIIAEANVDVQFADVRVKRGPRGAAVKSVRPIAKASLADVKVGETVVIPLPKGTPARNFEKATVSQINIAASPASTQPATQSR